MAEEAADNDAKTIQKRPSNWKKTAIKYGIDATLVKLMVKGAIAPTVGIAIYQIDSVAHHFSTIGYLIPVLSVLTVPVLPRARFIQNLIVTCFLICFAAAISLLAMWCAVKARENTSHSSGEAKSNGPVPGASVDQYNAAASANMGVWLFFEVWLANTFRAYRPQYFLPSIVYSIFINVTATYGTQFVTMDEAESLVSRLLEAFLAGSAISLATNLLVFPFTSRNLVFMVIKGEIKGFKGLLKAHSQYMVSLPTRNWYGSEDVANDLDNRTNDDCDSVRRTTPWPEADALSKIITGITAGQVKIQSELRYGKLEVTWGKSKARDMEAICELLRKILIAASEMESLTQVADRIEKRGGWGTVSVPKNTYNLAESEYKDLEVEEKKQWYSIFDQLYGPAGRLQEAMIEGLDHFLYTLELAKRPASHRKTDLEENGQDCSPGGRSFAARFERIILDFVTEREGSLREWCSSKGMDGPSKLKKATHLDYPFHHRHQSQLYLILDLQYSLTMTAKAILDLVKYADSKVDDGTMTKKRLIFPTVKQLRRWAWDTLSREDSNLDYQEYSTRSGTVIVRLSDAVQTKKDAEHLPPMSVWEKLSDKFRIIPYFFGSPESAFGFRVATGTMVISVACFLRNSQQFFIDQRIIWGSIMVAISMTKTAGSGIYGQFLRFSGTALAMVASYIVWYIVDQHTWGIISFLGITMFFYHYILIKHHDIIVVPMIGMVTVILIVGYELQVRKIGISISVSNGQAYHPLYELAPYRLATVLGGVGVAFFFTYFPSVITVRRQIRDDLGASLYLLGNYYSSVRQTVSLRIRSAEGDLENKKSPGRRLRKARSRLLAKEIILLQGMKQHCKFTAWEPTFGGKFPLASYNKLINHTQNIIHFTTTICHVTETFQNLPTPKGLESTSGSWLKEFKKLVISLELTYQDITTMLSIVAAAISTGRPLPPYLKAPEPVQLGQLLEDMDSDILSARHVCEPGYTAFAVMQVATVLLGDHLGCLLRETKKLVGEENFGIDVFQMEHCS